MSPDQISTVIIILVVLVVALVLIQSWAASSKPKPLTALSCGAAGVGKSTLINQLIGAPVARTGIGEPVTRNTVRIESPSGQLAFYDTQGLEVQDASKTYLLLMSDLLFLRFHSIAHKQIDIVLMCIQEPQGRIDEAHCEIAGLCEDLRIPCAIAITKKEDESNHALEIVVRQTFPRAEFVRRVRALPLQVPGVAIPAEGLDALIGDLRSAVAKKTDFGRLRARHSYNMSRLSGTARNLASTAAPDEAAWVSFVEEAWLLLGMQGAKWEDFLGRQRKFVKKSLVPEFWKRTMNTRFDNGRIDGALARRILPFIMRRFGDATRVLKTEDVNQANTEALATLASDRPYRSRF
jgi:hypothetical protein